MENLKKVKETILELIYPSKCPFCGEIVSAGKKHSTEHNGICKACREKLPYIGEVRCMCCGKPLTDPAEEYCYDCTRQKHLFVDGRSLWVHKDAVENAVYAMKYQNRRIYGQTFGKEMAEHFLPYLWERKITLIVPVPLHSRRKRKRGFNQAEIVAKVLSKNTGIAMDAGAVKRIKATSPQKELGDKGRKRNIRGAFAVQKNVKGEIMKKYDYLIVGAGLFGAVFAHEMTKEGKKCLVIDKRNHIAGNIYCENVEGINVHKYGAHIFHTSDKVVWEYINQFAEFNNYINSPVARYKDELYNLPFNMNTFSKLWGVVTPDEAKAKIEEIKNLDINLIFCSPLNRAAQTAKIVSNRKIPIIYNDSLTERCFGDFEGKKSLEYSNEYYNYNANLQTNNVEPIQDLCNRVYSFLDEIPRTYKDKKILLVTHGATARVINTYFNGLSKDGYIERIPIDNCTIKEFEYSI